MKACAHKFIVDRSAIGPCWIVICVKCEKVLGRYNYEGEAGAALSAADTEGRG